MAAIDSFKKQLEQSSKIDVSNPQQVAYWTRKWNITTEDLRKAVGSIGSNSVLAIETHLRLIRM